MAARPREGRQLAIGSYDDARATMSTGSPDTSSMIGGST
jgi:hypothetical protein